MGNFYSFLKHNQRKIVHFSDINNYSRTHNMIKSLFLKHKNTCNKHNEDNEK